MQMRERAKRTLGRVANSLKTKSIVSIAILCSMLLAILLISGCAPSGPVAGTNTETGSVVEPPVTDSDGSLAQLLGSRSQSLQLVGMITILSIAPAILLMMTGFTRIIIVLGMTRSAMGTQQMPPNQVMVGLALFLTFFLMAPIFEEIKTTAYDPYIAGEITAEQAVELADDPLKTFMVKQTHSGELELFMSMAKLELPVESEQDIPLHVIVPAFILSELKRAMQIGFYIYLPFLVIDMVVASTLMAMGMMMLPPITISLPFKILLFAMVDGWSLTVGSLLQGFHF